MRATHLLLIVFTIVILKSNADENVLPGEEICGRQLIEGNLAVGNAKLGEFPWLAALAYKSAKTGKNVGYKCAGTLINSRYVLTTSNCVTNDIFKLVSVHLGEYNTETDPDCDQGRCADPLKDFGIEKIVAHPDYLNVRSDKDIALIKLDKDVTFTDYIRPVCLSRGGDVNKGDAVISTGWGYTKRNKPANIMKKVVSSVISNEECADFFKSAGLKMTENQFCSRIIANNTDATCAGDSGAPVMVLEDNQWFQEGIVSMGNHCWQSDSTDVSTKISKLLSWIKKNVEA